MKKYWIEFMKGGLFLLLLLLGINNVNALELNGETYTTKNNVRLSIDDYNYLVNDCNLDEDTIDYSDEEMLFGLIDGTVEFLGSDIKRIITEETYDINGNVISTNSYEVSKEAFDILNNQINNMNSLQNGLTLNVYGPTHSTTSKTLYMQHYNTTDYTYTVLHLYWDNNHMPNKRSYDIIGLRYDSNVTFQNVIGKQISSEGTTDYSFDGTNMKRTSNGVGISMNLYDNATWINCSIFSRISKTSPIIGVSGSYQHATSNISLANSKSYTFSSGGLGGVFNHNYASYYDGMQGVYLDYVNI